jgi:hypothetical protein
MNTTKMRLVIFAFWVTAMVSPSLVPVCLARPMREPQVQEGAGRSAAARHIGAIKTIAGNLITLTPDSGPEIKSYISAFAKSHSKDGGLRGCAHRLPELTFGINRNNRKITKLLGGDLCLEVRRYKSKN